MSDFTLMHAPGNAQDWYLDDLVDHLWHEVNQRVPRAHVSQVATSVLEEFAHARVKVFVPLLVRRLTRERLDMGHGSNETEP